MAMERLRELSPLLNSTAPGEQERSMSLSGQRCNISAITGIDRDVFSWYPAKPG
jgi:hypothetical protein